MSALRFVMVDGKRTFDALYNVNSLYCTVAGYKHKCSNFLMISYLVINSSTLHLVGANETFWQTYWHVLSLLSSPLSYSHKSYTLKCSSLLWWSLRWGSSLWSREKTILVQYWINVNLILLGKEIYIGYYKLYMSIPGLDFVKLNNVVL